MYAVCLENLDLQNGMTFLDVGSGCGHFTAIGGYLVGKKGRSIGLDLRPDIIRFAQENIREFTENSPIDLSNVEFLVRNAFLPIPGFPNFGREISLTFQTEFTSEHAVRKRKLRVFSLFWLQTEF